MAVLTSDQIEEIKQILQAGSTALAVSTTGYEISKEDIQRLVDAGYINPNQLDNIVLDSYLYGRLVETLPYTTQMKYGEFKSYLKRNPVPLSSAEKRAYEIAKQRAGTFASGLGNRFSAQVGALVVESDQKLAQRTRNIIADQTAIAIAERKTRGELKTQLARLTEDWDRDWERVAATETQMAHQEGYLEAVADKHGDKELLAKIPEPGACKYCVALYLGSDGLPIAHTVEWWAKQGVSNVGRKPDDWKPVLGAIHPFCRCQLQRIPRGWGFNEDWELVPHSMLKSDRVEEDQTLSKARKLHGRIDFQGFEISIENRKGSLRHWYNKETDTHGTSKMAYPYGYIKKTVGADGDHCDVFIGPNKDSKKVFVIHQLLAPDFKKFDEDKIMLGWDTLKEAKAAYLKNYDRPEFLGAVTAMDIEAFREKVYKLKGKMIKASEEVLWDKAANNTGIKGSDHFDQLVTFAKSGLPEAKSQIKAFLTEYDRMLKAITADVGPVGTMGNYGDPARTAGESARGKVKGRDWPYCKDSVQKRKKKDLPRAQVVLDISDKYPEDESRAKPYEPQKVTAHIRELVTEDIKRARKNLVAWQDSFRNSVKLSE